MLAVHSAFLWMPISVLWWMNLSLFSYVSLCLLWHGSWGNDHRFTAAFHPTLKIASKSKSFNYRDQVNWSKMLGLVHEYAWHTWAEQLSGKPSYKLESSKCQTPGVVDQDVIAILKDAITSLPPVTKYAKTWDVQKEGVKSLAEMCRVETKNTAWIGMENEHDVVWSMGMIWYGMFHFIF